MGFMKIDAIPEAKYLCDTIEDLSTLLPRPSYGDTCWVISEACEYICNSKGEWLPREKASKTTANVDLTGYATEDFVQKQIQNIEHPTVEVPSKLSELENDANYAQQAYVDAKVADLVNSAPETLDTIGEIAQALKEHQDVADAITEAIGKKADKEDLPSIEGLASEAFVTEAIQKIEFPVTDLSNYYTKDEVTQAIADSAELPAVNDAHMHLVTDAEGNKAWVNLPVTETIKICLTDATRIMPDVIQYYGTITPTEIIERARYTAAVNLVFEREIRDHKDGQQGVVVDVVKDRGYDVFTNSEGNRCLKVYFDDLAPIIVDATKENPFYLDPDYIAPEPIIPETSSPNQHLITNAEGEKVWEERSHWMEEQEDYLVNTSGNGKYISYPGLHNLKPNKEYTIVYDGTEYKCISQEVNGIAVLGNLKYMNPSYEDTGEPFFFPGVEKDLVTFYAMFAEEGEHTFSIYGPVDIAKPLSELYMPQSVPVIKLASAKGQAVVVGDVKNGHPTSWTTATIPTKVSELENDVKHATERYVDEAIANIEHPLPEVDKAHQILTTNEKGEKIWEDKLCYDYRVNYEVYAETTIPEGKGGIMPEVDVIEPIVKNEPYIVTWDGVEYPCVAYAREGSDFGTVLGNEHLVYTDQPKLDNGLPFLFIGFYAHEVMKLVYAADKNGHVFSVRGSKQTNTVIPGQYIAGGVYAGTGSQSTVIGDPIVASAPGNGSVSLGGIADGVSAVAEGNGTTHSDSQCAHAEGSFTHAHGWVSHVEGYANTAYRMQHVQGRLAVEDPNSIYADIVGNGSQNGNVRSNAYALDWQGNAYFDGDVFVQGDGKTLSFDGAKKVATEEYVDTKVAELVDSAPETLDTLKEVADAIAANTSTAEALNQAIGNKVNKTDYPTESSPNQYLTTDEEGNKVWEEKLAYYAKEEKLLIPEQVVDANNAYVLHSNFEAQTGDVCRVILDGETYTGIYQNAGNGMLAAIQMTEGEGFPVNRFFTHFSDYGIQMAPLGFSGTLTVYVTTSVVHPVKTEYLGIPVMSGNDTYAVKIGNCDKSKVKGFAAIALNEAQALMPCALGVNEGIAEGWHSFAQGTGKAKDMCSSAFGVGTVSAGYAQMVSGKNNLEDLNSDYAVIVGNGQAGYDENDEYYVNHANAYTLDWAGNARYAGDVYVQGTDVDNLQDAKKVATEEYVNSLLESKADSADVVQANWEENDAESNAYVMNRPFYDSRTNIIEWDGETSDTIVTIPKMNVTLYRVSDTPLTKAELGTVTEYDFGSTKGYTNLNSDLAETADKKIIHERQSFSFVSVLEDGAIMPIGSGVEDVVFEKKGIYFWELKFSATASIKTQKIKYGAVTQIPDYYISNKIARQDIVQWISYSTPKTLNIYAADLDKEIITEVHTGSYIAGSGKNYTNNLDDALSYSDLKKYAEITGHSGTNLAIHWLTSEHMEEKRQALDLHIGPDGIGFHFLKDITFDETTGQPQFNLKKVWVANPEYVAE